MNTQFIRRAHHVTALIAGSAVIFYLFFQINKGGPLGKISPFANDPYDAVGSFAFQIALLVGGLSYARALRILENPSQIAKMRLVLHGNFLVLLAILVTLVADTIAVRLNPIAPSYWGNVLLFELAAMFLLTLVCCAALLAVFRGVTIQAPPGDLTPADAIDDLWTLLRVPVRIASPILPSRLVAWVQRFDSDWLFRRAPGINPRRHPWRFASLIGLCMGAALVLAQLQEGLPPSLLTGLLVAGIFISAEFIATLLGFAILGGYLGLRPSQ